MAPYVRVGELSSSALGGEMPSAMVTAVTLIAKHVCHNHLVVVFKQSMVVQLDSDGMILAQFGLSFFSRRRLQHVSHHPSLKIPRKILTASPFVLDSKRTEKRHFVFGRKNLSDRTAC